MSENRSASPANTAHTAVTDDQSSEHTTTTTNNNNSNNQESAANNNSSQNVPSYKTMASSQGTTKVHSVVPDLMRVYESLTKNHSEADQQQEQQEQEQLQQVNTSTTAPAQHVNYAFISSAEQYNQVYHLQKGDSDQDNAQMQAQQQQYSPHSMAMSLPVIPPPFGAAKDDAVKNAPSEDGGNSQSSERTSSRRKRPSIAQSTDSQEETSPRTNSGSSSSSSRSKNRKKAKETDGRWSKRFTWPDELHRDFVSAVFDVGLKHSSPSTILEHMPKHPQVTSERIKSHLQKYRVHRVKSKQEFMTSYESTLQNFQAAPGSLSNVKSLSNGEAAAHLSHSVLTDAADPSTTPRTANGNAAPAASAAPPLAVSGTLPDHEAIMLPKMTEAEKMSPIGNSMGHLLGLFFSLKKQLLAQRAINKTAAAAAGAKKNQSLSATESQIVAASPMVYHSSSDARVGGASNHSMSASMAMAPPLNVSAQPVPSAANAEWSSANSAHLPATVTTTGESGSPNAVAVQTGSTRTNLEASSMMKREMQNQMAFQNKMRALKQQELNKYTKVPGDEHQQSPEGGSHHLVSFQMDHQQNTSEQLSDTEQRQGHSAHQPNDQQQDGAGVENGDAQTQASGEAAVDGRQRLPSFSMGGGEDFWNADVMDDQLFEFLMDN